MIETLYDCLYQMIESFIWLKMCNNEVTPEIKALLRRKNRLMRAGRVEEAAAVAKKIGDIIIRSTSKSRPNNIRGKKCLPVRPSVRTSVRPQKVSSIWMKVGI